MAPNRSVLEVDALDLGGDVKATGLELLDVQSREPVPAEDAADTWTQLLPALAAGEYLVLDFFSHLNRVREYCAAKNISFREDTARCLVILPLLPEQMTALFERFGRETFGARAGATARGADRPLEEELSRRGLDAYQAAYARYTFCAVCELGKGWVTLLSDKLWKSEILRRLRKPAEEMEVQLPRIS
jgi:hypothetical protein